MAYHYTSHAHVPSILREGIRVHPHDPRALGPGERAMAWFTLADWEPQACEYEARIVVPAYVAPLTWEEMKRYSRMPAIIARLEEKYALLYGANPWRHWRGATGPVPPSDFVRVEVYDPDADVWRAA